MGAFNDLNQLRRLYELGVASLVNPGAGGTFDLAGKTMAVVTVTATGNYTLPNAAAGTTLLVCCDDTSTVTLKNAAGTTVGVFTGTSGTTAMACTATSSSAWGTRLIAGETTATDVTAAQVSVADAGAYTPNTTVEAALQELYGNNALHEPDNTAITTVGAGTLTAAGLVGGLITRSGPTAAYTDTTAIGTEITAALPTGVDTTVDAVVSWYLLIRNTVAFTQTLAAGASGVSLSGATVVPPNSVGVFFISGDPTTHTWTITGLGHFGQTNLPNSQFSTSATTTSLTAAAGVLSGSNHVFWENTADGAVALTTRTGAEMFADIPNCHIGFSYLLTILNRGDNTVTLTAPASGLTISGEATVATTTTRTWRVACTAANTFVATSVNKGTIET